LPLITLKSPRSGSELLDHPTREGKRSTSVGRFPLAMLTSLISNDLEVVEQKRCRL
jgi:hypothetical protein